MRINGAIALVFVLAIVLALVITPCYAVRTQKYTAVQAGYGGLTAHGGPLLVEQIDGDDLFKVTAATGAVVYTPTTTTGTAWTATLTTLTTGIGAVLDGSVNVTQGTLLKLILDSDKFTTGKFVDCHGGSNHATSVFSVSGAGNTAVGGTLAVTGATTLTGVATLVAPKLGTVVANTDASETLAVAQTGAIVTCSAAGGTTTITLPDPSAASVGVVYYIFQQADQAVDIVPTTANGNSIVAEGVATSDKVTLTHASNKIGAAAMVVGISATKWWVGGFADSTLTVEAND
jgi:hypothetical protein